MAQLPTVGNIPNPRAAGFDAILDDLCLRLAVAPDRRLDIATAPEQSQRIQTEQTSEDYLPEFGQVFSRNNFTGGEGLDFAFRSDAGENDRRRFWDSEGVDVSVTRPGVLDGVTLLPEGVLKWASTDDHLPAVRALDGTLFYAEANTVYEIPDPDAAAPTRNSEDPDAAGTNNVLDLCVVGDEVYAALGPGTIAQRDAAGVWVVLSAAPVSVGLWGVKGRVISDDGVGTVSTIDIGGTGSPTTLVTLGSGVVVNKVIDAGAAVLLAASDGQVYAFVEESGVLTLASQNSLTNVDVVETLSHVAGTLVLGTWDGTFGRIWRAQVGDANAGYAITSATLIKELNFRPTASGGARDAAYVGVRRSATEVELWRLDVATAGLSRDLVLAAPNGGTVSDVVHVGGRTYVAVADEGVYASGDLFVEEGYLISPMADFFAPDEKQWVGITIQADALDDGEAAIDVLVSTTVDALLNPEDPTWALIGRISGEDQAGTELLLPGITGRYAAVQLRLISGSARTTSPRLISFALRAYSDSEDHIVTLPINVSDTIERHGRKPFEIRGWGERVYSAVRGYHGQAVVLELLNPRLSFRGVVQSVSLPVAAITHRGSTTLYSLVTFRGRIVLEETTQAGEGTLGVALAGVHLAGT